MGLVNAAGIVPAAKPDEGAFLMTNTLTETDARARRIAELNDIFRSNIGHLRPCKVPGRAFITSGISALPLSTQLLIQLCMSEFKAFTKANDPYGEHDFGSLDVHGVGKVFWKIDYYADSRLEDGSQDPSDVSRCYRVLTLMLATEY